MKTHIDSIPFDILHKYSSINSKLIPMKAGIESRLKTLIETSTRQTAIEEWNEAATNQKVPLYNYRFDHIQQVVTLAKHLAEGTEADMEIITLAAWLHDVDKPGVGGDSIHGIDSAKLTEEILIRERIEPDLVAKVANVVKQHVGLTIEKPLEPIEAQILWEADKILKLGVVGLLQFVLNGTRLFPGRGLDEIAQALREFLPLATEIANCVVTKKGRGIAQQRLKSLQQISAFLDSEINM